MPIPPIPPPAPAFVVWTPFPAAVAGVITLPFPSSGNAAFYGTITQNVTFAFSGGSFAIKQTMSLALYQNSTGGAVITLEGLPSVRWPGGGSPPAPSTAPNALNVFHIDTTPVAGVYQGSY